MRGVEGRGLFVSARNGLFCYWFLFLLTFSAIGCVICEAQKTVPDLREILLNSGDEDPRRRRW